MNWEAVGATGEVLGSIAVVVTLLYLSIQIRQNTQSNRTAAIQTMASQEASWLSTAVQTPELAQAYFTGLQDLGSLPKAQQAQFNFLMAMLCRQYDCQLYLRRDGAIPEELWRASEQTLQGVMVEPGAQVWWPLAKGRFSADFQELVDRLVSENDSGEESAAARLA